MPAIDIHVSVFLSPLPIIDQVQKIKVNADKIIKVIWNRYTNEIRHNSSLSMNLIPSSSGSNCLANNLQQTCHSECCTQAG